MATDLHGLSGIFGTGDGFPGVVSLTMHVAYHRLQHMSGGRMRDLYEDEDLPQSNNNGDIVHQEEDIDTQMERIAAVMNIIVDAEVRRRAPGSSSIPDRILEAGACGSNFTGFRDTVNTSDCGGPSAQGKPGGDQTCGATTESDAPMNGQPTLSELTIIGDDAGGGGRRPADDSPPGGRGGKGVGDPAGKSSGAADASLTSLTPFILSAATECPFPQIRRVFSAIVFRMRDELNMALPDPTVVAPHSWFKLMGSGLGFKHTNGGGERELHGSLSRARFFVTHGEVPSYVRVLFGHWGDLATAHSATLEKLLYAEEGPLPLFDRLLCALIASSAHEAETVARYICAIMLRNGKILRPLANGGKVQPAGQGQPVTGTGQSGGGTRTGLGKGSIREATLRLLLSRAWPDEYLVIRRVCAVLARRPWGLKREDLDPILNYWSEPEMIQMLTIFSYFLGLGSVCATLKVPCDLSTSYETAQLLVEQSRHATRVEGEGQGFQGKEDDSEERSDATCGSNSEGGDEFESCSVADGLNAARDLLVWTSSEPFLSQLVNGDDNKDIIYQRRINKTVNTHNSLTTSMFSFEDGARSMLDTFFPTAADDIAQEFSVFNSIIGGGVPTPVRVSDVLKMAAVAAKPGTTSPPISVKGECDAFLNACSPIQPTTASDNATSQAQLRTQDIPDEAFWSAVRAYSMNVAGVVDLGYNYCDINQNVGKLAKCFSLTATMQPDSDPTEVPYGDPLILPSSYDEEECILALGLCAMYAKVEALMLRGLYTAK